MRKSKEKALEAYPILRIYNEAYGLIDANEIKREAFTEGYEQAIKDVIEWAEYQKSFEQGYDTGEAERAYRFAMVDLIDELKRH